MKTTHWTWESEAFDVPWRDEEVTIGKINQINNFCIGAQGNEKARIFCREFNAELHVLHVVTPPPRLSEAYAIRRVSPTQAVDVRYEDGLAGTAA